MELIPALKSLVPMFSPPARSLSPMARTIALREKTAEIEYYSAIGIFIAVALILAKSLFGGRR